MHALVTPPVGRALVPVALDDLPAASPQRLERRPHRPRDALGGADALNLRALVVVRHEAAARVVLDLDEVLVAAHAVQAGRGRELRKERGECGECLFGYVRESRKNVRV